MNVLKLVQKYYSVCIWENIVTYNRVGKWLFHYFIFSHLSDYQVTVQHNIEMLLEIAGYVIFSSECDIKPKLSYERNMSG